MKNKIIYILLASFGLSFFSCTKDFNEVNTDPIGMREVEPHQLMANSLVNVMSTNMLRNRNFNNELMQVTVDISEAEGKIFRYDVRRNWSDYTWNNWYINLSDFVDIQKIASQPDKLNKSYQGISLILQSWVYQLLTDTYGDVPFTEANQGRDGNYQPAFDRQKDIYTGMFAKLEEANELLKTGTAIVATSDPVFKGDIEKWRRFGNSLYLRLLLRVAGKAEVAATVTAKMKEIIETNAANYPIIENNDQTAKLEWSGSNSSTAVYTSPFMASVRANDFYAVSICDFFLGKPVAWDMPMVEPTLGTGNVPRWGIAKGADGYVGVVSGYSPGSGVVRQSYFYAYDANNATRTNLQTDKFTGVLMNAAEVSFIKAEAAARGWIGGNVADYYYLGMAQTINYWMPTYITSPTDAKFTSYVTTANLTWDPTLPLDNLTFGGKSQLEMIHIQKYYAMFLVDFQQWFEYRRTGHPILPKGTGLVNNGKMPARMFYPVITQSANPANYKDAVAAQGPDDINTLVWWQKP